MVRLICAETEYGAAANLGGPVNVRHKTFDVDLPDLEAWLKKTDHWTYRSFVGIELSEPVSAPEKAG